MERITVKEAARELCMPEVNLRCMMYNDEFQPPIGIVKRKDARGMELKKKTCYIYRELLEAYKNREVVQETQEEEPWKK